MKTRSLTRTLIVSVLLAEMLCAMLFAALAITHETSGRRHGFDVMLEGRADALLGAIQDAEDRDDHVIVDETELRLPREDAYLVTMDSGAEVGQSPVLPDALRTILATPHPNGYFDFKVNGRGYRALRQPGLRIVDRDEQQGGMRRPVVIVYAAPTAHLWHEALEAVRFYVIASCLLLLATGLLLSWSLRASLSPLRELALRAESVSAASWDFHVPEGVQQTLELRPIATSIQKLLASLRGSFERQKQFTGDAAHELKTSLAVLKSGLQLLLLRERNVFDYQQGLETAVADTERMEALTNRILTLARAEQAPVGLNRKANLSEVMNRVSARIEPSARQREVLLKVLSAPVDEIMIASHDLELVCSNLLMNAVQHSPQGSVINLFVQQRGEQVELIVVDRGDGIPEESLPHIFERFYRADYARSRTSGGVGLGLAICKAIIDRHGGTIEVSSTLGAGTTVKVLFPRAPAAQASDKRQEDLNR